MPSVIDTVHAFMPYPFKQLEHANDGPLANTKFAVKDLFDVAGYPTGCGCPLKLAESGIALKSAEIVDRILEAGAEFAGKTKTDELAWSLEGINPHFGTPVNAKAPDRTSGGSSAGSASAVAAGLVDIAIGTDTGGSVRAPASFCGLWGIRPTHGRLSLDRCMTLAPSFDTLGFFTRDGSLFEAVASVLFEDTDSTEIDSSDGNPLLAVDMLDLVATECVGIVKRSIPNEIAKCESVSVFQGQKEIVYNAFRVLQAHEALKEHGEWIELHKPPLTEGVADRFKFAAEVSLSDVKEAEGIRDSLRDRINEILKGGKVIFAPTVPSESPLLESDSEEMLKFRHEALSLLCVAGLCGLPQISIPVAVGPNGAPLGLSLIGPYGSDLGLIRFARRIFSDL